MKLTRDLKGEGGLLLIAALMLACNMSRLHPGNSNSSSAANDNPSRSGSAFKPSADARRDLGDALRKLKTAYPYRLTETGSATMNGQTAMQPATRMVDFAAPDRSHMKLTGGSGSDMEMITIGDKHYWYSDGKWTESAGKSAEETAKRGMEMEKMLAEAIKE